MSNTDGYFLLATASVVGVGFHDWKSRMRDFVPGLPIKIQAEPTNAHDKWAVRIVAKPEGEKASMVGYIPGGSRVISMLLQYGHSLVAVAGKDPDGRSPSVEIWAKDMRQAAAPVQKVSE